MLEIPIFDFLVPLYYAYIGQPLIIAVADGIAHIMVNMSAVTLLSGK